MELSETITVQVRFSEVDALQMVWHGNYLTYLEDAREAFGRKYGLEYMTIYRNGYQTPMYDLHVRYHSPSTIDATLAVRIRLQMADSAKIIYDYEIRNVSDGSLVLEATSIQLFTDLEGHLEVNVPDFYQDWMDRMKSKYLEDRYAE